MPEVWERRRRLSWARILPPRRRAVRVSPVNRFLSALLICVLVRPAWGHATSTSYLLIDAPRSSGGVALRWDVAVRDIVWSVYIDRDYDGAVTLQEIAAARRLIDSAVLRELELARGGEPCKLGVSTVDLVSRDGQAFLSVALSGECPRTGLLAAGGSLFMSGDASQRVLVSAGRGREKLTGVISPTVPVWDEPMRPSAWGSFVRFLREGIWHVASGYDHVAFELLLLLPSVLRAVDGRWRSAGHLSRVVRDVVTIITAFTVAHSTTLALAVTGVVRLPTRPIEVAIAASIAVAGGLNLLPRLSRLRLPLAFGFGFVH